MTGIWYFGNIKFDKMNALKKVIGWIIAIIGTAYTALMIFLTIMVNKEGGSTDGVWKSYAFGLGLMVVGYFLTDIWKKSSK